MVFTPEVIELPTVLKPEFNVDETVLNPAPTVLNPLERLVSIVELKLLTSFLRAIVEAAT